MARSQFRLGLIDADLKEPAGAVKLFDEALARLGRVPSDEAVRKDTATILHHRGRVLRLLGRLDPAEASYGEALAAWRGLRGDAARHGEATTLLGLGNVATQRKRPEVAKKLYAESLALRQKLVEASPRNEGYQRDLATAWQNLAAAEQALGDRKA